MTGRRGRVNLSIRITPELHERLLNEAGARDLSANYLVTRAIEEFLEALVPIDEWKLTR